MSAKDGDWKTIVSVAFVLTKKQFKLMETFLPQTILPIFVVALVLVEMLAHVITIPLPIHPVQFIGPLRRSLRYVSTNLFVSALVGVL